MSDDLHPQVYDTHGGVHAGDGDLYINYYNSPAGPTGKPPRKQAADDLLWLKQRFAYPPGFGSACDILESYRTVFLDAPAGSGRTAAAKILLWDLKSDAENLQELLPQEKDGRYWLNFTHIGDGDRTWLDLSSAGQQLWRQLRAELPSLRAVVHERAAHLVVVLPSELRDPLLELDRYRVRIKRPETQEVLSYHLRAAGIQPGQLPADQLPGNSQPLREILRYVQLIPQAREQASGEGDLAAWCATAHQAWLGQETEVAALVASLSQGPQRALLLATAMLHGAHADVVDIAAASFLQAVEHPPDDSPLLERAALDHRLKEINAELDAAGNIRFATLGYDLTIRAYLWTHLPALHKHICDWVGTTAESDTITEAERADLVSRFTEQCLPDRYQQIWKSLVRRWTSGHAQAGMKAAAFLLRHGLRDEAHGRIFRRQIYDWSRRDDLSHQLVEVLTGACRYEMAISHPDEALVRLHHLARRERSTIARKALVELASGDRRLLRQMLTRLTDRGPEQATRAVDASLFLELTDPAELTTADSRNLALLDNTEILRQLTTGWALAFANLPPETWQTWATRWLLHAAEDDVHRHALLDVVVGAAAPSMSALARLYALTHGPDVGPTIGHLLLQKINAAQGLQLT